ncbi:hypothetical protein D3C76_795540 [compost metagenome]
MLAQNLPVGSRPCVLRRLNVVRDQKVGPLTGKVAADTHAAYRRGLVHALQAEVNVKRLYRGLVASGGIRAQARQDVHVHDDTVDEGTDLARQVVTRRDNHHPRLGILDQTPDSEDRCDGGLCLTTLGLHHKVLRPAL